MITGTGVRPAAGDIGRLATPGTQVDRPTTGPCLLCRFVWYTFERAYENPIAT